MVSTKPSEDGRFVLPKKEQNISDRLDLATIMYLDLPPEELMEVIRQAYAEIGQKEVAEKALKEGDQAPDFSLFDVQTGRVVSSAALLQEGPVVMNFFRGGWCEGDIFLGQRQRRGPAKRGGLLPQHGRHRHPQWYHVLCVQRDQDAV